MKVLVLDKFDWKHPGLGEHSEVGGAKKFLKEQLSRLTDRGHEVKLLSARFKGSASKETTEGVEIRRIGFPASKNLLFIYTIGQLYANYLIRKEDPDVILSVHSPLPWFLTTNRPRLNVYHVVNGKKALETWNFPKNLIIYLWERLGIKASKDPAICVSKTTAEKLEENGYEGKTHVIKNGIDAKELKPGEKSRRAQITYLGRLNKRKGVSFLPKIYEKLKSKDIDFEMHVAGEGEERGQLEDFASRNEDFKFHGFVSEREKKELLQKSWLLVVPSKAEGYGIVVIEANSCGTPAVGNDVQGLQDSIKNGETGFLEDVENTEEFCDRIQEILTKKELRKRLSENCREFAQKHSWDEASSKLEDTLMSEI